MHRFLISASILGLAAACGQPASGPDQAPQSAVEAPSPDAIEAETARLNAWFDEKYEAEIAESPIQQTMLGRDTNQDEIDDYSLEAQQEALERSRANLAELRSEFDYDLLTDEAKTSYDLWVYQAERAEAAKPFWEHSYIFSRYGPHEFLPQLLMAFHRVQDAEDMDNYLARIPEAARALNQTIDRAEAASEKGLRPPYFAMDMTLESAAAVITGAPFDDSETDSAIWGDAKAKIQTLLDQGEIDEAKAEQLRTDIEAALLGDWQAAYERLLAFQEAERAVVSEEATGVSELPNGDAYYEYLLAGYTMPGLTAEEIHQKGLDEVARLRGEMEVVKDAFGFDGTLEDFFDYLRETQDDPRLFFDDTDEGRQAYLDEATAAIEKIEAVIPDYFGVLPKGDLVVKRVEPFREQAGGAQHYYPGTPDGSRPGTYYVHLADMTAMPKMELEVIAYHEGLPGHHMQIAIQQELEGLPFFRTQERSTAYTEGWALYTEALAAEMPGTFEDPISEFGRLNSEMWRAIRLVMDTGIHTKGWTEQQSIDYFLENSATSEAQVLSEVRRYFLTPGQATSYKIGMMTIQDLRAEAQAELGDAFDIRDFHDVVLEGGSVTLPILQKRVTDWIDETKAETQAD